MVIRDRVVLTGTIIAVSVLMGLSIPAVIPAVAAINSHAMQAGSIPIASANGTILYVTLGTPSGNVTYACGPVTWTVNPAGPQPYTNTSKVSVINLADSTFCHKVNG